MTKMESKYPLEKEIKAFMDYHGIENMDELIALSNEVLFKMDGITMHIMAEINYRRDPDKKIDQ